MRLLIHTEVSRSGQMIARTICLFRVFIILPRRWPFNPESSSRGHRVLLCLATQLSLAGKLGPSKSHQPQLAFCTSNRLRPPLALWPVSTQELLETLDNEWALSCVAPASAMVHSRIPQNRCSLTAIQANPSFGQFCVSPMLGLLVNSFISV